MLMKTDTIHEVEIDLWAIWKAIRRNIAVLILSAAALAIIACLGTILLITPGYDSTTLIYVLNKQDNNTSTVTNSDLESSTQLTKDYMELVTTHPVLEGAIANLGFEDMTYEQLKEKIKISTLEDGRIISIMVTDSNPMRAKQIADAVRNSVSIQIVDVMNVESVNVVEEANVPVEKSSPNIRRNMIMGGIFGLFLSFCILIVVTVMDDRIKTEEDVEHYLQWSVLGTIPLENSKTKKTEKKIYSKEKRKGRDGDGHSKHR